MTSFEKLFWDADSRGSIRVNPRKSASKSLGAAAGCVTVFMDERLADRDEEETQGAERNLAPVIDGREICPQCGRALQAAKCKLVCECGYFMSCSDY